MKIFKLIAFFSKTKIDSSVSRFSIPNALDSLDPDLRKRFLEIQRKIGFIPNIILLLSRRPAECKAFFEYHDALMGQTNSSLSKSEKEMIVVTTSCLNQCLYCVVAHGAILRIYEKNPFISDQLAVNYKKSDLSLRHRLILDFAVKVSRNAENMIDEDYELMQKNGFNEEDIWDISSISAFFAMSNRIANSSYLKPNREFYALGRNFEEKK